MGLKSFGMIYLAVLDNQETITTRQKKRSNQRDKLSPGTCLSAAVLPALSWAQIRIFYKEGNIRAVCNHTDMPGCEKQSILIYSQALTMVLMELHSSSSLTPLLNICCYFVFGDIGSGFPHFTDKISEMAKDHMANQWCSKTAN